MLIMICQRKTPCKIICCYCGNKWNEMKWNKLKRGNLIYLIHWYQLFHPHIAESMPFRFFFLATLYSNHVYFSFKVTNKYIFLHCHYDLKSGGKKIVIIKIMITVIIIIMHLSLHECIHKLHATQSPKCLAFTPFYFVCI